MQPEQVIQPLEKWESLLLENINIQKILNATQIKIKNDVVVERISCIGKDDKPISFVVKHLQWKDCTGAIEFSGNLSIKYESVAYKFLTAIRQDFDFFPRVYKIMPGVIVMEDLGKWEEEFSNEEESQRTVVSVLSQLHASSLGKAKLYNSILSEMDLTPMNDTHKAPYLRQSFQFSTGMEILGKFLNIIGENNEYYKEKINKAYQVFANPPAEFQSFLHNDFVALRQSVLKNKKLHILDFEHASFGHSLVDICNLYIGKIQYKKIQNQRVWVRQHCSSPAKNLQELYQELFEKYSGQRYSPEFWNYHFASIAIVLGVSMLGALWKMPAVVQMAEEKPIALRPIWIEVDQLLKTCCGFLKMHPEYAAVLAVFKALQSRLNIFSSLLKSRFDLVS